MKIEYKSKTKTLDVDGKGTILLTKNSTGLFFKGTKKMKVKLCVHHNNIIGCDKLTLIQRIKLVYEVFKFTGEHK